MTDTILHINIFLISAGFISSFIGMMFSLSFKRIDRGKYKFFVMLFAVLLVYTTLTGIWIIFRTKHTPQSASAAEIVQSLSYLIGSFIMPMVSILIIKAGKKKLKESLLFKIVMVAELFLSVILVLAPFTELFFYTTPDNQYRQGPFFYWMFIPPLVMFFSNLAAFIMYYPKYESRYRLISIVFNSIPIICMVLQILLPEVLFITMGAGMAGLILMTVLYRDQLEKYIRQADLLSTQKASLLALQMRPHYIFNVLTSIYYICDQDPSKAQTTIADFTSYLRKNFTAMVSEDTINFADELEHTRAYLAVEQVRFDGKINVKYNTQVTAFRLPPLTLQPIVENAVKHGIGPDLDPITITIRTAKENGQVKLTVENTGVPFESSSTNGDPHTALDNIKQRLWRKCGATMEVSSSDSAGTVVTIMIPVS